MQALQNLTSWYPEALVDPIVKQAKQGALLFSRALNFTRWLKQGLVHQRHHQAMSISGHIALFNGIQKRFSPVASVVLICLQINTVMILLVTQCMVKIDQVAFSPVFLFNYHEFSRINAIRPIQMQFQSGTLKVSKQRKANSNDSNWDGVMGGLSTGILTSQSLPPFGFQIILPVLGMLAGYELDASL
ncbi:MAG: hypothetical protein AAGI66_04765 [Cyanobacteria bacterium P01_H01_bin.74]